jgi:hypothetical protein
VVSFHEQTELAVLKGLRQSRLQGVESQRSCDRNRADGRKAQIGVKLAQPLADLWGRPTRALLLELDDEGLDLEGQAVCLAMLDRQRVM